MRRAYASLCICPNWPLTAEVQVCYTRVDQAAGAITNESCGQSAPYKPTRPSLVAGTRLVAGALR
jgi:hypothetical protein